MKIVFEFTTQYGIFRDALHLSDDSSYTDFELNQMKQERLNNWIAIITKPIEVTGEI